MTDYSYIDLSAEELREKANRSTQRERESFERCDTDGFVSQFCDGLYARLYLRQAEIAEAGGMAEFDTVYTLEGERVPVKRINGRYGPCWAILDADGKFTGEFLSIGSKPKYYAKRGYEIRRELRPAMAVVSNSNPNARGFGGLATSFIAVIERTG